MQSLAGLALFEDEFFLKAMALFLENCDLS
jgi:hypothetical protein